MLGVGWMNILGDFNMLWHNFEINKPMFELSKSVRFTEYLTATFKSLHPNIYISTSASRFDDTLDITRRDNRLSQQTTIILFDGTIY